MDGELAIVALIVVVSSVLVAGLIAQPIAQLQSTRRLVFAGLVGAAYAAVLVSRPPYGYWADGLVILAAATAGALIGVTLRSRGALIAFLVTVAAVDFVSYTGGLTRLIVDDFHSGSTLLLFLAVCAPVDGVARPIVGVGDILSAATVVVAMRELGFSQFDRLAAPATGLLAALGVGLTLGGVYALPFMSATCVAWLLLRAPAPQH